MHELGKGYSTIPNCRMSQWVLLFNYQAHQTTELPSWKKDVPVPTRDTCERNRGGANDRFEGVTEFISWEQTEGAPVKHIKRSDTSLYGRVTQKKPLLKGTMWKHVQSLPKSLIASRLQCGKRFCGQMKTRYTAFRENSKQFMWCKINLTSPQKSTMPRVKYSGSCIILYGCVLSAGTGHLVKIEGRMDGWCKI